MPKVIIFSGRAQAGKDTSAAVTQEWLNKRGYCGVQTVACATALKQLCHDLFGIPKEHLWGTDDDKNRLSPVKYENLPTQPDSLGPIHESGYLTIRQLLQYVGSDIFRKMFPDCWVNSAKKFILDKNIAVALILDARFPNEIDSFASDPEFDTYVVRLMRNPRSLKHMSETALDNYVYPSNIRYFQINNENMSLETKNALVERILHTIANEDE